MAKAPQATAQNELGEVSPPSSSSSTPDREQRISAIVSLVERLSGDAQLTVIEDERSNLEAFLTEPYSETHKKTVRAILNTATLLSPKDKSSLHFEPRDTLKQKSDIS